MCACWKNQAGSRVTIKPSELGHSRIRSLLLTVLIAVSVLLVVMRPLDDLGARYLDSSFKQALASFAIARGLNGVISVAQGTEIAVQPAGVGINFTPGEILDPVNDLIERFSWIMLLSSSSIGAQKVLLAVSSWYGLAAVFVLVASVYLGSLWWQGSWLSDSRRWISRLFLLLLLVRFSVPLVAVLNEWVYQGFLQGQHSEAAAELQRASDEISEISREPGAEATLPAGENGLIEQARQLYDSALGQVDFSARLDRYKSAAETISENTIQLIVVYILQTILFPLLFLWGLVRVFKWMIRG